MTWRIIVNPFGLKTSCLRFILLARNICSQQTWLPAKCKISYEFSTLLFFVSCPIWNTRNFCSGVKHNVEMNC